MKLKLLFIINDQEKKLNILINKFHLPFNVVMHGLGTASQSILDFFDLIPTEKNILLSIISSDLEKPIITYLRDHNKMNEVGKGIGFTIPLSSSPKYMQEAFKEKEDELMNKKSEYHLIVTIVNSGNADKVMKVAKKCGANGGTLLKGRDMEGKNSFKFFNMTIEPEKDILLIVCKNIEKNKIMEGILHEYGANTSAGGICYSLPVDSIIGFE